MRFPWKHRSTRFLQYKITNVKFYIVETTTLSYKITIVKFYIVEITTLSYKITNVKFYIVETTTLSYKITNVKFYIVEITTLSYKITNVKFYIVEIIMFTFFQRTNIKFYIVEPKTPLDNQLQCRLSHINRKLFLSRPHKPEGLKEILKHPKVTTTRRSIWKINRLKQPE